MQRAVQILLQLFKLLLASGGAEADKCLFQGILSKLQPLPVHPSKVGHPDLHPAAQLPVTSRPAAAAAPSAAQTSPSACSVFTLDTA